MLTIGEFSNICRVSTKTLRYYAEIGLIQPEEINPENGYRYYSINQLERMLFINRLKTYHFSLEEIKGILESEELQNEQLFVELNKKRKELALKVQEFQSILEQMDDDICGLKQGRSVMTYLKNIDVQLVEVPAMHLLSVRKNVLENEFAEEYGFCFGELFRKLEEKKLTMAAPPMVLFHSDEYSAFGLDTEFAIPVKEYDAETREFCPGFCLKTVVHGAYSQLPSAYAKQIEWAKREGYESSNALYEVYVSNPAEVLEKDLITEVYYPVKKKALKGGERK